MRFPKPNALHRFLHKFYRWRPITWILAIILPPLDKFFFYVSRNKVSIAQLLSGLPIVLIGNKGAKSNEMRYTPLIGIPTGESLDNLLLIATNWGGKSNPSWYYNLKKNSHCTVTYKGETSNFEAEEVIDNEDYNLHWNIAVGYYSGYINYRKRAAHRKIPLLILSPVR